MHLHHSDDFLASQPRPRRLQHCELSQDFADRSPLAISWCVTITLATA
jgi:hypothetical protein